MIQIAVEIYFAATKIRVFVVVVFLIQNIIPSCLQCGRLQHRHCDCSVGGQHSAAETRPFPSQLLSSGVFTSPPLQQHLSFHLHYSLLLTGLNQNPLADPFIHFPSKYFSCEGVSLCKGHETAPKTFA